MTHLILSLIHILAKYAEAGELATQGKPLFKVADVQHLFLRAYITADQLSQLKLGDKVKVFSDLGKDDRREYEGTVSYTHLDVYKRQFPKLGHNTAFRFLIYIRHIVVSILLLYLATVKTCLLYTSRCV